MTKEFFVYMMTNAHKNVLYTGVTSNLPQRIAQHKHKQIDGFTKKYNLACLVYYEAHDTAESAILREKEIKKWRREKKDALVNTDNPKWIDLYDTLF